MNKTIRAPAVLVLMAAGAGPALAQDDPVNVFKVGITRYDTHSQTNGVTGIGAPDGADATITDATTLLLIFGRMLTPNLGVDFVLGIPPKIEGYGAGSVDFLGKVVEARSVSPALLVNWHFGEPTDTFRPCVGVGINYTHFANRKSPYGWKVHMEDSWGPVVEVGFSYRLDSRWSAFGSIAAMRVKSEFVAVGPSVIKTEINYRPVAFTGGVTYSF